MAWLCRSVMFVGKRHEHPEVGQGQQWGVQRGRDGDHEGESTGLVQIVDGEDPCGAQLRLLWFPDVFRLSKVVQPDLTTGNGKRHRQASSRPSATAPS